MRLILLQIQQNLKARCVRSNEDVRKQVKDDIYSIVKGITGGFQADFEIDYLFGYPALFNHRVETETVRKLAAEHLAMKQSSILNLQWALRTLLIT